MDYGELERLLSIKREHCKTEIVGSSVLGRYIYGVSFDFGYNYWVIIQGSIHAREHITTDLILKLIDDLEQNYNKFKAMKMPNIMFVPMVNPDGVEICINGLKSVKNHRIRRILKSFITSDLKLFKANANGVDLNNNFDAKWGSGKENCFVPAEHGFVGTSPMSEPEVQALALLTIKLKPFFTISYHAKGQEVYYEFYNKKENLKRDKHIAKLVAKTLSYSIKNTQSSSSGGYKDWCVLRFNIPAVTIEVGKNSLKHPIKKDAIRQIYRRNKNILKILPKILEVYKNDTARKIHEKGT